MKVQSILSIVFALALVAPMHPSEAKGSSGGGSRSSSSSSSRSTSSFGSSSRSNSSSGFGSSSRSSTSSGTSGTKSSASAFSRGPSAATKAVATSKAQSLNNTSKPLTQAQLASSGVKTAKPSELGMTSSDTSRLASMQTQHNALQNIPDSQRNTANPVYVQQQAAYDRDRIVFIQSHPTTYIPVYGSSYGPYDSGNVRYVEPAEKDSGFEKFMSFLGKMILVGFGGFAVIFVIAALYNFYTDWKTEKEAKKAQIENEQKRF